MMPTRLSDALAAWRRPSVLAMAGTILAFYLELLHDQPPSVAALAYLLAALVLVIPMFRAAQRCGLAGYWRVVAPFDLWLVTGLVLAALLPDSQVLPLRWRSGSGWLC